MKESSNFLGHCSCLRMVCVSDLNVDLYLDVNLSKQNNLLSGHQNNILRCYPAKKACEVMTTILKVSFVIYTSSQNLSGYFGLTTIMTCKIFTDIE